ncbi:hypothetical protein EJF36_02075 [Bacillus sp. HMF5848]|uniref:hypothetical protein n=1 Tax=Bacillus sp. HMF5848 TaxID=2495421 RepID=UPI000F7B836F|nr:hypothetical protein [Bacillus sp. HMF5848]RSK25777.1 hypothetical protein EJF36_02075 [Bacillus sp. HMF5848]
MENEQHRPLENEDSCTKFIKKDIKVGAEVEVTPHVNVLEPEVDCSDKAVVRPKSNCHHHHHHNESCKFIVEQELTLKIPLKFSVEVDAKTLGVNCDPPKHDCKPDYKHGPHAHRKKNQPCDWFDYEPIKPFNKKHMPRSKKY